MKERLNESTTVWGRHAARTNTIYNERMLASVGPKRCASRKLCGAIYVEQSVWCALSGARYS
eukprot:7096042-Pyramimonas_sp.AAC.1